MRARDKRTENRELQVLMFIVLKKTWCCSSAVIHVLILSHLIFIMPCGFFFLSLKNAARMKSRALVLVYMEVGDPR